MAKRRQRIERRRGPVEKVEPRPGGGCQANVGTYEEEIPCPDAAVAKFWIGGEDVWFCPRHAEEFSAWRRSEDGKLKTINAIERTERETERESDAVRVRRETEERLGLR